MDTTARLLSAAAILAASAGCSFVDENPRSADPYERYLGALRLVEEGDPVEMRYLFSMLRDPNPLALDGAVIAIGEMGEPEHAGDLAAVLTPGPDRKEATTPMVRSDACRALAPDLAKAGPADIVNAPAVRAALQDRLDTFAAAATGSSNRIVALVLLADLPSLDAGEITDKGSINQRAVLRCRQPLVTDLYAPDPPPHVVIARSLPS